VTSNSETSGLKTKTGDLGLVNQKSPAVMFLAFIVERQAAAIGGFLCFFRFGVLTLEIGEPHVQRLVAEHNSGVIGAAVPMPYGSA
jgi:hypothetical protein